MKKVEVVCPRDCYDSCFITAVVEGGRIISLKGSPENPVTQGFTCPRGAKDRERVHSQSRILYPHIRIKPSGELKRVSWDKALGLIVDSLQEVLVNYGPQAVLHLEYAGNMGLLTWYFPQRLWNALGATKTDYSICTKSGHEAIALHYGLSYGVLPEDLLKRKMIIYWGFNARTSSPHLWALSLKARRESDAIIAVIDPRRSETAKAADIWLNPRPGSDVALAYGLSRYLIEHDYVDLAFVEEWSYGYELFKKEVLKWAPGKVEETTGLRWGSVEELGEYYGRHKPSATMVGIGLQKSLHGAEAVRAITLIPALLGHHRGFYYSNSRGWSLDIPYITGESLTNKKAKIVSQVALGRHLEAGEFKFIYVYSMNPASTLPDQKAVRKGLGDSFVVLHDTHWTETAKYADVVLPAPTFLEKEDIVPSYSHPYVRISRRVIHPLGESRDEVWFMRELANRLKVDAAFVFEDPWEAVKKATNSALEGLFEDLIKGATLKLRYKPENEYQTPTGKIEFHSTKAEELDLTPFPVQLPIEVGEDQFFLLNNALPQYTHTQFQEVYGPIHQVVWINTDDLRAFHIGDRENIFVYNELGAVELQAIATENLPRGVLWSPRELTGFNGEPQNTIIPATTQKIGGGPTFNSTIVKIRK